MTGSGVRVPLAAPDRVCLTGHIGNGTYQRCQSRLLRPRSADGGARRASHRSRSPWAAAPRRTASCNVRTGRGGAPHIKAPAFHFGTPVPQSGNARVPGDRHVALRCCVHFPFDVGRRGRGDSRQFSGWAYHHRARDHRADPNIGPARVRPVATGAADGQRACHHVRNLFIPLTCVTCRPTREQCGYAA